MNLVDELQKLEQLYQNGSLTAEEFALAKTLMLSNPNLASSSVMFSSNDLAEVKALVDRDSQLSRLDREWESQKQRILNQRLILVRPFFSVVIIFGILWGIGIWYVIFGNLDQFDTTFNSSKPSLIAQYALPILGIALSVVCLWFIFKNVKPLYQNGNSYQTAHKNYQAKRDQILHS